MEQRREHFTTEGWSANVKATFQNFFEAKLLVRTCVMLMELTHWFSEMVDKGDRNNCEDCPPLDDTDVQVDSKEDLDMTDLCPDSYEAVESVDHKPCGKSRNIEMSVDITDNESPLVHDDINPSCNLVEELDFGQLGALFYHATSSLETISQMFIENDDTSDHTRNHTKQKPHTQKAKPSNINLKVPSSGRVIENILRKLRLMVKQCESWLSSEENKTKLFEANSDLLVQDVPTESSNVNVHASACQTTSPVCSEQSSQTTNECYMVNKGTEKYDEEAQFEKEKLEQELAQSRETWKRQENHFKKQRLDISQRNIELTKTLASAQDELRETLLELGRLSVENTKMIRENQTKFKLLKELQSKQSSTATPQPLSLQTSSSQSEPTLGAEALSKPDDQHQLHDNAVKNSPNEIEGTAEHPPDHTTESAQLHREESNVGEVISLSNVPTTAVERSMYNNYKLLLFTMPPRLLFSDVEKLKEFASRNYSIDVSQSVVGIFLELDRKGVISASNLTPLREFFEGALRFDLIHLIDCFLLGDYAILRNVPKNNSGITNTRTRSPPSSQGTTIPPSQPVTSSASGGSNPGYAKPGLKGGRKEAESSMRPTNGTNQTFPVRSNSNHVRKSPVDMGSNGNKLSKFERSDSPRNQNSNRQVPDDDSDDDDDSQWLCSHYKRRCLVKFDCCDKYWPCHRCHNNESNCGQKKLKSRDTKFIKCVNCKTEQEFGEGSQFCVNCKAKLAKYFCSSCKHLTGTDDHPYHCGKCGICRIHQNRSFHCDVCGVCLDVQLRGNHKCRAGSAHDECCICLEDAFTGCQILPCSHKVHKECATQMIRSGITRCPICRESFAHKLERRTLPPPKKHNGKK